MQRGRKSTDRAQLESAMEPGTLGVQPDAPPELSPDEAKEWQRFWAVSPTGWFPREVWPLLIQLCRHICQARFLGECLQEVRVGLLDPRDIEQIRHLELMTRLHDREGRAMTAIMEKLRLTTQQRVVNDKAAPQQAEQAPEVRPWIMPGTTSRAQ